MLFASGNRGNVLAANRGSSVNGPGFLDGKHSLTIHAELVDRLPPVLRIFAGCAAQLIGDIHSGGDALGGSGTIHKTTYIYQGMTHANVANQLGVVEKATINFLKILDQLFGEESE